MSNQVFINAGFVFVVFVFLISVIIWRHMITTETFGLYKFDNDHLLRISKLPDAFC